MRLTHGKSRIALISCTSLKEDYDCPAIELYSKSPTFRLAYAYAEIVADDIYILSAKYGLVSKDKVLAPYNDTLLDKSEDEKKDWSNNVLAQLKDKVSLEKDEFVILAGNNYCKYLLPSITNYYLPLEGKRQGERQPALHRLIALELKETRILFEGSDLGEVYAISMAKTLGCISLVTDDIKERGPHYTLMRIQDSDVMPFAFYELLFLDYLEERLTEQELLDYFNCICDLSNLKMDFKRNLKSFIKRFWRDPYTESEKEWMKSFCAENGINAKIRMRKLSGFLQK